MNELTRVFEREGQLVVSNSIGVGRKFGKPFINKWLNAGTTETNEERMEYI